MTLANDSDDRFAFLELDERPRIVAAAGPKGYKAQLERADAEAKARAVAPPVAPAAPVIPAPVRDPLAERRAYEQGEALAQAAAESEAMVALAAHDDAAAEAAFEAAIAEDADAYQGDVEPTPAPIAVWRPVYLNGAKCWAQYTGNAPDVGADGKVTVVYHLTPGIKEYRARPERLGVRSGEHVPRSGAPVAPVAPPVHTVTVAAPVSPTYTITLSAPVPLSALMPAQSPLVPTRTVAAVPPPPVGIRMDQPATDLPSAFRERVMAARARIADGTQAARSVPSDDAPGTIPAGFEDVAATGAAAAAVSGLARGFIAPEDVNPSVGYNVPVTAARGQATTYAANSTARTMRLGTPMAGRVKQDEIKAGNLVAGAREEASGILVSWAGLGELTRAGIIALLGAIGLPVEWAPKAISAHAQAGAAVSALNRAGVVARAVALKHKPGRFRTAQARWQVVDQSQAPGSGNVGDVAGRIVLTVTLDQNNRLTVEGDEHMGAKVANEYQRTTGAETYKAAAITDWLQGVMVSRFGAIAYGSGWYIPAAHIVAAETLCAALSEIWGRSWGLPALPVTTSAQLRDGLGRSLINEIRRVLADLNKAQEDARKAKRERLAPSTAAGLMTELKTVAERTLAAADLLGGELAKVRAEALLAAEILAPLANDTSTRFAAMFDDLATHG